MSSKPRNRRADLASIHMLQAGLGMSADDAEALKISLTGKASAADMTDAQRALLIGHLIGLRHRMPAPSGASPQLAMLERIWTELGQVGALRDASLAGLDSFVKAKAGVASRRFLGTQQAGKVIEALKSWLARAKAAKATA